MTTKEIAERNQDYLIALIDLADNAIAQGEIKHAVNSLYLIKMGLNTILTTYLQEANHGR